MLMASNLCQNIPLVGGYSDCTAVCHHPQGMLVTHTCTLVAQVVLDDMVLPNLRSIMCT